MKKILIILSAIPFSVFGQKIEGYVAGTKMRMIEAETAQLSCTFTRDKAFVETYYRLLFSYNDHIRRVESDPDDHIPQTAPSVSWIVDFLNFNGWEKVSVNEDPQALTVTIYVKKKHKH